MIGAGFKLDQAKALFFDRKAVTDATDRGTRRMLSRFGAYVMRRGRSSIRRRKKVSDPGKPPSAHEGSIKKIYFGYEPRRRSVVVGPVLLNLVSFDDQMRPVSGAVPEVLEKGGAINVLEEWTGSRWWRVNLRRRGAVSDVGALRESGRSNVFNRRRPIRKRRVTIAPRPTMRLAFEAERPKLQGMWANSIRP